MRLPGKPAVSYEDWIAKGIESVQRATAEGRLVFLTLFPGEFNQNDIADVKARVAKGEPADCESLYRDREYKLAMFLICAGERSYLGYQVPPGTLRITGGCGIPTSPSFTSRSVRPKARRPGPASFTPGSSSTPASASTFAGARVESPGERHLPAPDSRPAPVYAAGAARPHLAAIISQTGKRLSLTHTTSIKRLAPKSQILAFFC